MIYPETIEHKIGFDTVRQQLKTLCISALGAKNCEEMTFSPNRETVVRLLEETSEMVRLNQGETEFPLGTIHDMTETIAGMRVDGVYLSSSELLKLRNTMETMASIASFFKNCRNEAGETAYPRLDAIALTLMTFPSLVNEINRVIDRWGNIKDNASAELASIRSALSSMSGTINSIMRRVVSKAVKEGYVETDTTPSVRDGRLVIPVSPMNKRKIPGIVHDESASGKTFFIEPAEVVEANNRLRELEMEERREIIRILADITSVLRPHADEITGSLETLGVFDFIYAKSRYATDNDASMPRIGESCDMDWFYP